jgi:hypothetical protein
MPEARAQSQVLQDTELLQMAKWTGWGTYAALELIFLQDCCKLLLPGQELRALWLQLKVRKMGKSA